MKKSVLNLLMLILAPLMLTACATPPTSMSLAPQLDKNIALQQIVSKNDWFISSQDLRTARYLIAISSGDDVAQLVNETTSSRISIEKTLQAFWLKQGLSFTAQANSPYKIDIQILKLLAQVEQGTMSHETDINVVIKVQLTTAETQFSKTFRNHYSEKAPLSADVIDLTTQLNMQLSQLLDQIVQDPELIDKLMQL